MLLGLYSRGGPGFALGFVALLPWLLVLDRSQGLAASVLSGGWMSLAFALAVFSWFGVAIGEFSGLGSSAGLLVLLLAAPLMQAQFLAFAVARDWAGRRGPWLRAFAGASAWVACEWLWPHLLGDSLGHGLYPAEHLRQAAAIGGVAGLSFTLILVNEALALAWTRRALGRRAWAIPLLVAACLPALLYGYGRWTLATERSSASPGERLRIGLVQSNLYDYEGLRQQIGAYGVVRQALDTHYALSRQAVASGQVDALLWSETVYPTTFGHPKSEGGAELDREILDFVKQSGVPLVFGTYDVDAAGEYNAAAFVEPGAGLIGFYRKTRAFPLTEHVPDWLDGPNFRRWFPWAGTWREGNGARVFPLRLADGREIPVLPLICLDDVDGELGLEGARQGARAILTLSNDSWFTAHPVGADLHLAVAAFRSIETRLPQFRVTANGRSALIGADGAVMAEAAAGQEALLLADAPLRDRGPTGVMRWGHWVGPAASLFLLLLAADALRRRLQPRAAFAVAKNDPGDRPEDLALRLPLSWRVAALLLQACAWAGIAWMGWTLVSGASAQMKAAAQMQMFAALVLAPQLAVWAIARAHGTGARREFSAWCLQGATPAAARWRFLRARMAAARWRMDHPVFKFLVFPLVPALPAFRLHQLIAYGGVFGEYYSFGLKAWLLALLIWWASWAIGLVLYAAVLRLLIEAACAVALLSSHDAGGARRGLEGLGRLLYFLGVPLWLLWRVLQG